jgi:hypothetical protein
MSLYTVRGSNVFVGSELDTEVYKSLPVKSYVVNFSPTMGFFLTVAPDFELPAKLYGDTQQKAERFLNTFDDRPGTTGVLLSGAKGSGKSLVMKLTSILGLGREIPTIIVSSKYCGEAFNQFVQSIEQPCIMIFDEFEKIYDEKAQESLLTLFDGTFTTKKLAILTCNDPYKIDKHMTNRPGRMYYYLKYSGVTEQFIREYCADRLHDTSKTQSICTLSALFYEFNFDMLKALVEELNRYPTESVKEVISILNIQYDYKARTLYDVKVIGATGAVLPKDLYYPHTATNPFQEDLIEVEIYQPKSGKMPVLENHVDEVHWKREPEYDHEDDDRDEPKANFTKATSLSNESVSDDNDDELIHVRTINVQMQDGKAKISPDLSSITYRDGNLTITFTKQVFKSWDYSSLL